MSMRMDKVLSKLQVKDINDKVDKINASDLIDFVARIDYKFDSIEAKLNSVEIIIKKIKSK